MKNNAYFGGYQFSTTPNPTQATATPDGSLGSNGAISAGNNNRLDGALTLGPGGSVGSSLVINGSQQRLAAAMPAPASPAWTPGANPGGVSQSYSASGNIALPSGNYWFTSLTVSGTLTFGASSTVIVNGPVNLTGTLKGYDNRPGNLKIKQLGNNTFGNSGANNAMLIADVEAPGSALVMKNNFTFQGRMVFRTINVKNNASFFYDTAIGSANDTPLSLVQ